MAGVSQEEGRSPVPRKPSTVRLSGMFSSSARPDAPPPIPLRRIALWGAVGVAIVIGVVLYFRYARQLTPLIS